ncbi:hypothetical protein ABKN59_006976 [Abortiporus biennis]
MSSSETNAPVADNASSKRKLSASAADRNINLSDKRKKSDIDSDQVEVATNAAKESKEVDTEASADVALAEGKQSSEENMTTGPLVFFLCADAVIFLLECGEDNDMTIRLKSSIMELYEKILLLPEDKQEESEELDLILENPNVVQWEITLKDSSARDTPDAAKLLQYWNERILETNSWWIELTLQKLEPESKDHGALAVQISPCDNTKLVEESWWLTEIVPADDKGKAAMDAHTAQQNSSIPLFEIVRGHQVGSPILSRHDLESLTLVQSSFQYIAQPYLFAVVSFDLVIYGPYVNDETEEDHEWTHDFIEIHRYRRDVRRLGFLSQNRITSGIGEVSISHQRQPVAESWTFTGVNPCTILRGCRRAKYFLPNDLRFNHIFATGVSMSMSQESDTFIRFLSLETSPLLKRLRKLSGIRETDDTLVFIKALRKLPVLEKLHVDSTRPTRFYSSPPIAFMHSLTHALTTNTEIVSHLKEVSASLHIAVPLMRSRALTKVSVFPFLSQAMTAETMTTMMDIVKSMPKEYVQYMEHIFILLPYTCLSQALSLLPMYENLQKAEIFVFEPFSLTKDFCLEVISVLPRTIQYGVGDYTADDVSATEKSVDFWKSSFAGNAFRIPSKVGGEIPFMYND